MSDHIFFLDGHQDFFMLKNAFSLPRFLLTIRWALYHHPVPLAEYGEVTRSTNEASYRVQWLVAGQTACLVRRTCLRTAADMALPAFLSSRATSNRLVNDIPPQSTKTLEDGDEARAWLDLSIVPPFDTYKPKIGTTFSALQPSPPLFPYSTSIVCPFSWRLRVMSWVLV